LPAHADWPRAIAIAFYLPFVCFWFLELWVFRLAEWSCCCAPAMGPNMLLPDEQFPFRREHHRTKNKNQATWPGSNRWGPRGRGPGLFPGPRSMGPPFSVRFAGPRWKICKLELFIYWCMFDVTLLWRLPSSRPPFLHIHSHVTNRFLAAGHKCNRQTQKDENSEKSGENGRGKAAHVWEIAVCFMQMIIALQLDSLCRSPFQIFG